MSDNARFHNKLHRKNHHSAPTPGYPDSATDPIASATEPFKGDFYVEGDVNVTGALRTTFFTLSNINIAVPELSAVVGFKPTNSLIVQLSGIKYAIPLTYVGSPFDPATPKVNSLSANTTYLGNVYLYGPLSGNDASRWNNATSTLISNSASWANGFITYTIVSGNSSRWESTYNTVNGLSAAWTSTGPVNSFITTNSATMNPGYNATVFAKLSAQPFTFNVLTSSIQANSPANNASGTYSGVLGGFYNTSSGYSSIVVGGGSNTASGRYSIIGGGSQNQTAACMTGILGGSNN